MARKKAQEEHVNHERWLVSYADFITLLFAFFVIMYALSEVDQNKLKKFSKSVQFAFSHVGTGGTMTQGKNANTLKPSIIGDQWPKGRRDSDPGPFESLSSIVEFLESSIMQFFLRNERADVMVFESDKGVVIRIPAERLFAAGSASLRRDRAGFFEEFGAKVATHNISFRVALYVDVPYGTNVIAEHALGMQRVGALVTHIRRSSSENKARFSTVVDLVEQRDIETSSAEKARSVFEFYLSP